MDIRCLHSWDLTPKEAVALQRELACQVDDRRPLTYFDLVAGADVSYDRYSPTVYAGVVVLRAADLSVVERQGVVFQTRFPYVPGLLSFREAPALLAAFALLKNRPDVVLCDGQGLAHPRRFGLACHMGLWLDVPTMGCAKSRLIGTYREPGQQAGAGRALKDGPDVIGRVVRTRTGIKPVFVSAGHKIDLPSAVRIAGQTTGRYRIPEPTRQAHLHVNALRRNGSC